MSILSRKLFLIFKKKTSKNVSWSWYGVCRVKVSTLQTRLNQIENKFTKFLETTEIIIFTSELRNQLFKCLIVNPGRQPGAIWVRILILFNNQIVTRFRNVITSSSLQLGGEQWALYDETTNVPRTIRYRQCLITGTHNYGENRKMMARRVPDNRSLSSQESTEKSWPYPWFASHQLEVHRGYILFHWNKDGGCPLCASIFNVIFLWYLLQALNESYQDDEETANSGPTLQPDSKRTSCIPISHQ